ncbi:MAG TPA: RluA family pseudouridine synthase [Patescibacteria group bacterium]|nr:RluA family pseudouridine synthase [Patescibacteria group bacterium]
MPPDDRRLLTVSPEEARQRLDQFLAGRLAGQSRSYLQKLIREGHVSLVTDAADTDGRPHPHEALRLARRVMRPGESVEVFFPPAVASDIIPEEIPLAILHEDSDIIVIDKPAGLVVHPGAGARSGTLVHALLHHCSDLSGIGGVERPGIVHRLDKETSGVLVVAKNDTAHRQITRQFQERTVTKIYMALVWGRPEPASGSIDLAIGRDSRQRLKISARTSAPRDAFTQYRQVEALPGFSWLEVTPRTGRTHQIRVHMKHLGHPIAGDTLYGGAGWKKIADPAKQEALRDFRRLALHARRLSLRHPTHGSLVTYEAPVPAEIEALLDVLRRK